MTPQTKQQNPPVPANPNGATRAQAEKLLGILERSRAGYAQLVAQFRARREAIRGADFARFAQLGASESRIVAELAELDRARLAESRALAVRLALAPDATLGAISARLGPVEQARMDLLRGELRTLVETARGESSVVKQAAERLSAHMAGILQTVHSALAHANVYSRGGRIAVGANVLSSLDLRS
jgi:hypothetical protein